MMTSLRGEGKSLHGNFPICDSSGIEDDASRWTPVTLMNTVNVLDLPLKVLAYHMCYRESGSFSVIYWESDSTLSLVPNTYLRRRVSWDDDDNHDNGESRSCADEITDDEDVKVACGEGSVSSAATG
jgi:hypothetical protein